MDVLVLLLLAGAIVVLAGLGLVVIFALTLTWRRQQRRLSQRRPSRVHHLDAWHVAGMRYHDPAEVAEDPANPFRENGDAEADQPPADDEDDNEDTVDTDDQSPDDSDGPDQSR
jgi:hypothetical protein